MQTYPKESGIKAMVWFENILDLYPIQNCWLVMYARTAPNLSLPLSENLQGMNVIDLFTTISMGRVCNISAVVKNLL